MEEDNESVHSVSLDTEDVVMSDNEEEEVEEECVIDSVINSNIKDITANQKYNIVSKENRISKNKLTKYEFVRIIGERTKQLTMGAKPLIKIKKESENLEYNEIAIEELKLNMIPFKIKRLVNGNYEIWELNELDKKHLENLFE
jgi:DNA-directed RNA polymerase subunit K/omega